MRATKLSYCAAELRRHDRDRYLTALFAPADRREALFTLYAFNLEVARSRELVREPMMGRFRLQWWRDAIAELYAGRVRRHQILEPLAAAVAGFGLTRDHFDRLIDAREWDMEDRPPADLDGLIAYADGTSASLVWLALQILDADGASPAIAEIGRAVGIAWALTGLLRAAPFHARARRVYLPQELMDHAGMTPHDMFELRSSAPVAEAVGEVVKSARRHLDASRLGRHAVPRRLLPALLPATLAEGYLNRIERACFDVFHPSVQEAAPGRTWRLALAVALGRY